MNQWSRKFTECIVCHSTENKHKGRGVCRKCFFKYRYQDPVFREKWRLITKNWRAKNVEKNYHIVKKSIFKSFLLKHPEEAKQTIKNLKIGKKY